MSQKQQVLKHLESGRELSPIEAFNLFGTMRLSAIIFALKKEGIAIDTRYVQNNNTRGYAVYSLKRKKQA